MLYIPKELASVLMLLGILPSLLVVGLLRNHQKKPGVIWLVAVAFGFISWSLSFIFIFLTDNPTVIFIATSIFVISPFATSIAWFFFCYEFSFKKRISKWAYTLFALLLFEFALALTNPLDLMYTQPIVTREIFPAAPHTLRFVFNVPISYILVLFGTGMIIGEGMQSEDNLREKQAIVIFLTSVVLILVSFIKVLKLVPVYFDPIPMAVSLGFLLLAYSIEKHQLGRRVPIARQKTVELFDEVIMIVTNEQDEIIDVNKAARNLFGEDIYTHTIDSLLKDHTVEGEDGDKKVVSIETNGQKREFNFNRNQIMYGRGIQGHIHILSEITEIKKREEELDIVQTIMQRIFRHNVRNQLTPILGYAQAIKHNESENSNENSETSQMVDKIIENADNLLSTSEKAIEIGKAINERDQVRVDLKADLESAIQEATKSYEKANISLSGPTSYVYAHQNLRRALREAIENGLKYNSNPENEKEIDIRITESENYINVWIADNGDKIPESEIEVLHSNSETSHKHSNGAGLWLIKWVIERSNGTQKYYSYDEIGGTVLKIELQKYNKNS